MEKVLIAIDGSPASMRAVDFVIALAARAPTTHIHLINVQSPPPAQVRLEAGLTDAAWQASLQEAGRHVLEPVEKALDKSGLRFTSSVCVGEPVHEIIERAHSLGCTQIVMGTRGMSALGSLVLGSVATRVVHHVTCPVTLVK